MAVSAPVNANVKSSGNGQNYTFALTTLTSLFFI